MSLSRQKLTLIGIFALFLGPVILVMLMRSDWWQYQPAGMQNKGFLVQPPVRLALDRAGARHLYHLQTLVPPALLSLLVPLW